MSHAAVKQELEEIEKEPLTPDTAALNIMREDKLLQQLDMDNLADALEELKDHILALVRDHILAVRLDRGLIIYPNLEISPASSSKATVSTVRARSLTTKANPSANSAVAIQISRSAPSSERRGRFMISKGSIWDMRSS